MSRQRRYSEQEILNSVYNEDTESFKTGPAEDLDSIVNRPADAFEQALEATSSTTPQKVREGNSGKSIYLTYVSISTDTAQWVRLEDEDGLTIVAKKYLPANSVWTVRPRPTIKVAAGKDVMVDCGGSSGNISVELKGRVF